MPITFLFKIPLHFHCSLSFSFSFFSSPSSALSYLHSRDTIRSISSSTRRRATHFPRLLYSNNTPSLGRFVHPRDSLTLTLQLLHHPFPSPFRLLILVTKHMHSLLRNIRNGALKNSRSSRGSREDETKGS